MKTPSSPHFKPVDLKQYFNASLQEFGEIGPATLPVEGNPLGDRMSTYGLRYADGSEADVPVVRRFAIQQNHISWSASAFAALPLRGPIVHASTGEDFALGGAPSKSFFLGEARTESGRMDRQGENLWLYALPNPNPEKEFTALSLRAEQEVSLVFA